MPNQETVPPAAKARTIAHMNKDHNVDLLHMLQHFEGVTAGGITAENIQMVDIDLDSLTVVTGPERTRRVIRFRPPMKSFDERRQRLIGMTMVAREALGVVTEDGDHGEGSGNGKGRAKIVVREYRPPEGAGWIVLAGVVLYFGCYAVVRRGWADDGTVLAERLERWAGAGAAGWFRWVVWTVFLPVLGIHLGEVWWFDRTRCVPYGVERGSRVWWLWLANVFWEGYGTFVRFDRMVKAKGKKA